MVPLVKYNTLLTRIRPPLKLCWLFFAIIVDAVIWLKLMLPIRLKTSNNQSTPVADNMSSFVYLFTSSILFSSRHPCTFKVKSNSKGSVLLMRPLSPCYEIEISQMRGRISVFSLLLYLSTKQSVMSCIYLENWENSSKILDKEIRNYDF